MPIEAADSLLAAAMPPLPEVVLGWPPSVPVWPPGSRVGNVRAALAAAEAEVAEKASGLGSAQTILRLPLFPPLYVASTSRCLASRLKLSPLSISNDRKM